MAIVFTFSSEPGMFRATTLTSSFFISSVFLHDLHYLSIPLDDLGPSFPLVIEVSTYGIRQSFTSIFFFSYVELALAGIVFMSPPIDCTVPATMVRCALLFFYLSLALLYYHFLTWDGSILLVLMVIFLCVPESHLKGTSLHLLSYTLIHV